MEHLLLWSEDDEIAYGNKELFETKEDFINQVKAEYESFDGKKCEVKNVKIEPCIETGNNIPRDVLIPLSMVDVSISNYYTATVIEIE